MFLLIQLSSLPSLAVAYGSISVSPPNAGVILQAYGIDAPLATPLSVGLETTTR